MFDGKTGPEKSVAHTVDEMLEARAMEKAKQLTHEQIQSDVDWVKRATSPIYSPETGDVFDEKTRAHLASNIARTSLQVVRQLLFISEPPGFLQDPEGSSERALTTLDTFAKPPESRVRLDIAKELLQELPEMVSAAKANYACRLGNATGLSNPIFGVG